MQLQWRRVKFVQQFARQQKLQVMLRRSLAYCLANASQSAVGSLPQLVHIKRNIANYQTQMKKWPPFPKRRRDIDLSGIGIHAHCKSQKFCNTGYWNGGRQLHTGKRMHRAVLEFDVDKKDKDEYDDYLLEYLRGIAHNLSC